MIARRPFISFGTKNEEKIAKLWYLQLDKGSKQNLEVMLDTKRHLGPVVHIKTRTKVVHKNISKDFKMFSFCKSFK